MEKTERDIKRLVAAARVLTPYLHASDDRPIITQTHDVYMLPVSKGDELRYQAQLADEKDDAIKKFRIALAQFEE